jgi:hypothetical protein
VVLDILRAVTMVESLLRARPLTETPILPGVSVNLTVIAKTIQDSIDGVKSALVDVEREKREAQLTLPIAFGPPRGVAPGFPRKKISKGAAHRRAARADRDFRGALLELRSTRLERGRSSH